MISTFFPVALEILIRVEVYKNDYNVTRDFLERTVDKDAEVICMVISRLYEAELIQIETDTGIIELLKEPKDISLLQVYSAITPIDNTKIFRFDTNQRKKGSMMSKICAIFTRNFRNRQETLRGNLEGMSLQQILTQLHSEYRLK